MNASPPSVSSAPASVRLAIDLGASSGRIIAGWMDGETVRMEEWHRFENRPVPVGDALLWNPLELWESILEGLTKIGRREVAVESIGCDTWGVDYVLLRGDGLFAGPCFNHRDGRNHAAFEKAMQTVGREKIFDATGLQFLPINTLYQLIAERDVSGSALEVADGLLLMGDFFHYLLTDRRSIEATNASTTQLLDPRDQTWRKDLIEAFDLPEHLFAPVTQPGTVLGNLTDSVARRTGIDNASVIIPATHDTASAVISVPVDDFAPEKPDWCYISCGTWSLMGVELASPMVTPLCETLNFTNEGGVAGSTRLLKNIGGLWVFQQIRASLQRRGQEVSWSDMVSLANGASPLTTLIDPDAPMLLGPSDMVDAVHEFVDRTGQRPMADDGAMFRAALEGLALRYRFTLDNLEQLVDGRLETIYLVGGGSQNELLCQMTADACNRTVVAGPSEATAIGNLMVQMIGAGELPDVASGRRLAKRSFETNRFTPARRDGWEEAFERFVHLRAENG